MDTNFPEVVLRPGGGRRCRVLFSYSPQNDDELQLQVNDEIDFLAEVEYGWWKGRLGNKIGVFPSNFVCEVNPDEAQPDDGENSAVSSPDLPVASDDAPVLPPKPIKEQCRVLFPYDAANDDELTLKKDDVLTIITKEVEDKGWWKGELRGKIGLFPNNFVELLSPPEEVAQCQQKKPDRPSKTFDKTDGKPSLISVSGFQKILQENATHKEVDEQIAGLKNEGPFSRKNAQNLDKSKTESSSSTKLGEKNLNVLPTKGSETAVSHRRSLEMKSSESQPPGIMAKKPALPPPVSNKPKPVASKPGQVKRLSEELNDLIESTGGSRFPGNMGKRLSGEAHDLVDGGVNSKGSVGGRLSDGNAKEDFDLDLVERTDMLTHMTSSRPRPPGRRLPTKDVKDIKQCSSLTNGNVEANDKEKSQKEREWEKHKPPWVNELKLNLKSNKTSPSDSKFEKKSAHSAPPKSSATQSPVESPLSSASPSEVTATATNTSKQSGPLPNRTQFVFESGSKVSELSSKFSSAEKPKQISPSKSCDAPYNSLGDQANDEVVHVSKKEFLDLKSKVDKLGKLMKELTIQLCEEADKRKLLEKELNKLTNLVTQV